MGKSDEKENDLRRRAEKLFRQNSLDYTTFANGKLNDLIHELQVHQIELELQNEELRKAHVDLAKTHRNYTDLYDNAPVGYITSDPTGKVLTTNRTMAEMLLVSVHELKKCGMGSFCHDQDVFYLHCRKLLKGKDGLSSEILMRKGDGTVFTAHITSKLVPPSVSGEYELTILSVIVDISDNKRLEKELRRTMAELNRSNRELEQFAYALSHDLQAPLRSITNFTQMLASRYKGRFDDDADRYFDIITGGATRMKKMIEDILAYSRAGSKPVTFVPFSLETSLAQAIDNLFAVINERDAVITHDPLHSVLADQMQMTLLLQNLLENALKFCTNTPRIHVSSEKKAGEYVCSIRDNGIGIAPRSIDRLFAVFQRLHTVEEFSGTGVGLAICKKIVDRHGGRIWVESQPGKGSIFSFTVPSGEQVDAEK